MQMNMVQAIGDALRHEMKRDNRIVVLGEDVAKVGGVFRVTAGLYDEFTRLSDEAASLRATVDAAVLQVLADD